MDGMFRRLGLGVSKLIYIYIYVIKKKRCPTGISIIYVARERAVIWVHSLVGNTLDCPSMYTDVHSKFDDVIGCFDLQALLKYL